VKFKRELNLTSSAKLILPNGDSLSTILAKQRREWDPSTNLLVRAIRSKNPYDSPKHYGFKSWRPHCSKNTRNTEDKTAKHESLAHLLEMDYKTVKHHLDLLKKNKIIVCEGEYGPAYFLSQTMEDNYGLVEKNPQIVQVRKKAKIDQQCHALYLHLP